MRSASSRWIWSAIRARRAVLTSGERARDLDHLEHLELVADLDIVEVPDRKTAFESGFDLAHVVLEALERIELARMHDDTAADDANRGAAADQPFGHHAAGDGSDLRDLEDVAHFDEAENTLLALRRQHARDGRLHVVDRFVNDVVVADVDARM